MTNQPNLRVRISADLADVKQGLSLLRGELASVKRQAGQGPDTSRWTAGLKSVRSQLAGIVSVYAALRGVQAYTRLADEAANLTGRLRLSTKSQEEFNTAHRETYRIAQSNSAQWESIVSLYQRLSQSTNLAQRDVLGLTDTVSKAFAVSGAGPQDMANGLRQLSQALAGGVLRAEEFNSIMDTSPRIVQALADHFGIEFGKVRKHVNDGKVTTQEFVAALQGAAEQIAEEYSKLPPTVSRATQQVRNALLALVSDTDKATGASADLARGITDLARTLESPEVQQGFATFVSGVAKSTGELVRFLGTAAEVVRFLGEEVASRVHGPTDDDLIRIEQRAERIKRTLAQLDQVPMMGDRVPDSYDPLTGGGAGRRNNSDTANRLRSELVREQGRAIAARVRQEQAALVEAFEQEALKGLPADVGVNFNPNGGAARAATATADALKKASSEAERLRREAEAAEKKLQQELEARGVRVTEGLQDANVALLEATGRETEAAFLQIDLKWAELLEDLKAAGDAAGTALVNRVIDLQKFQARMGELRDAASAVLGNLQGLESSVAAQVGAGMLGSVEGEGRLREAREVALVQLVDMRGKAQAALAAMSPDSPEAASTLQFIGELDAGIAQVVSSLEELRNKVKDAATEALTNFFMDLVDGSKSAGDALRDFVRGFALAMAQIAARALATMLVLRTMDALWPGSGKLLAASMNVGQNHGGGLAGDVGGIRRQIPAALLGLAPRYHSGGIAGMKPNEVGAVLEFGEEVLTLKDPRHRDNIRGAGAAGRERVTTPIVVFGESELANALAGRAGEQMVITHVRNNRRLLDD